MLRRYICISIFRLKESHRFRSSFDILAGGVGELDSQTYQTKSLRSWNYLLDLFQQIRRVVICLLSITKKGIRKEN